MKMAHRRVGNVPCKTTKRQWDACSGRQWARRTVLPRRIEPPEQEQAVLGRPFDAGRTVLARTTAPIVPGVGFQMLLLLLLLGSSMGYFVHKAGGQSLIRFVCAADR
ncbi:hypothetical protein LX32DRAFT_22550 [Colletotrichum zoysiae]|uniref:Uncharacterized protein n=1 Tax=Colletotrichum zoysiae TaxID=1216348 RepID=A0AAD9HCB3_9PEZI|nr:hypothetical protein LX32DRAFT_22550 [Colletotrichum zoysiae]